MFVCLCLLSVIYPLAAKDMVRLTYPWGLGGEDLVCFFFPASLSGKESAGQSWARQGKAGAGNGVYTNVFFCLSNVL